MMDKDRETEVLKLINELADTVGYLASAIDGITFPFRAQVSDRVQSLIGKIEKLHGGRLDYPRRGYYQ